MQYTDGRSVFDLPKMTLDLEERFGAAGAEKDRRASVEQKFALMVECLGADYVRSRCDAESVEDADLCELDALFIDVSIAYNMNGYGEVMSAMAELAPLMDQVERINAITGGNGHKGRQGFRRVL